MFGTNKLCIIGIYLPTFQRSIILPANEGRKNLFHYLCFYIYIIYRFLSIISLDFSFKRQDTVTGLR